MAGPKIYTDFLEIENKKPRIKGDLSDPVTKLRLVHFILQRKIVDTETGCWFPENVKDKNKYSSTTFEGISATLQRLSAAAFLNFDLDNTLRLEICHKCDIKACFNPEHLYVGTHGSNKKDYWERNARISPNHCAHGHEFVEKNGKKVCLICRQNQKEARNKRLLANFERWQEANSKVN